MPTAPLALIKASVGVQVSHEDSLVVLFNIVSCGIIDRHLPMSYTEVITGFLSDSVCRPHNLKHILMSY